MADIAHTHGVQLSGILLIEFSLGIAVLLLQFADQVCFFVACHADLYRSF
jgi:hypothetical protein